VGSGLSFSALATDPFPSPPGFGFRVSTGCPEDAPTPALSASPLGWPTTTTTALMSTPLAVAAIGQMTHIYPLLLLSLLVHSKKSAQYVQEGKGGQEDQQWSDLIRISLLLVLCCTGIVHENARRKSWLLLFSGGVTSCGGLPQLLVPHHLDVSHGVHGRLWEKGGLAKVGAGLAADLADDVLHVLHFIIDGLLQVVLGLLCSPCVFSPRSLPLPLKLAVEWWLFFLNEEGW